MNNLVILPLIIPLITGIILMFLKDHVRLQRIVSVLSFIINIGLSAMLVQNVYEHGIQTHELGDWPAPFGIVLVADLFASMLVLTANIVSFCCVLFAFRSIGSGREKFSFYAFVQFLITGVIGAFLTGDIFNLFVFFEVMLMSSYVLIVLGGTKIQLRESIKYILVNVISSALFVIAVGYLYSVTGTLNMADLSVKIKEVGQPGILTVIAVLFLVVFGLKGAIFPLYFWLPSSYQAPPSAVTALFGALLTKVGVYSIFRTFTLLFYHDQPFTHTLIGYMALLTIVIGCIGAIAYSDIKQVLIYNIVIAVGVILYGLTIATPEGLTGSVYYLLHDMVIKGTLFLLAGAVIVITGTSDMKQMGGLIKRHPLLGWMFFVATIALAGIPPLSGFIGKLLLLRSGLETENYTFVAILLISSLAVLYSVMKIFMNCFWREPRLSAEQEKGSTKGLLYPSALLLVLSIFMGVGAEWIYPYVADAAKTLADPSIYIHSVLKE